MGHLIESLIWWIHGDYYNNWLGIWNRIERNRRENGSTWKWPSSIAVNASCRSDAERKSDSIGRIWLDGFFLWCNWNLKLNRLLLELRKVFTLEHFSLPFLKIISLLRFLRPRWSFKWTRRQKQRNAEREGFFFSRSSPLPSLLLLLLLFSCSNFFFFFFCSPLLQNRVKEIKKGEEKEEEEEEEDEEEEEEEEEGGGGGEGGYL